MEKTWILFSQAKVKEANSLYLEFTTINDVTLKRHFDRVDYTNKSTKRNDFFFETPVNDTGSWVIEKNKEGFWHFVWKYPDGLMVPILWYEPAKEEWFCLPDLGGMPNPGGNDNPFHPLGVKFNKATKVFMDQRAVNKTKPECMGFLNWGDEKDLFWGGHKKAEKTENICLRDYNRVTVGYISQYLLLAIMGEATMQKFKQIWEEDKDPTRKFTLNATRKGVETFLGFLKNEKIKTNDLDMLPDLLSIVFQLDSDVLFEKLSKHILYYIKEGKCGTAMACDIVNVVKMADDEQGIKKTMITLLKPYCTMSSKTVDKVFKRDITSFHHMPIDGKIRFSK